VAAISSVTAAQKSIISVSAVIFISVCGAKIDEGVFVLADEDGDDQAANRNVFPEWFNASPGSIWGVISRKTPG
jgi:hypothetical protein